MKITNKLIEDIAALAKLEFDAKSAELMKADLEKIIGFVDKLSEIDTEGVEPLIYLSEEVNVLREDEIRAVISQVEALKNAPQKDSDYFKVSTVLKNES
ncbi:MAG TPA: Asp-tRNA(Asn)/Glu-tRNA(Gln) amidotransferase subunit GatC [Flavobacteriales bacterium]|jgi:aspartyl-tRNA(Asn)/glutamyl-tRNA(Gln) amidotransferase subunit C|nr:Asp-tRNA(Asn)/Glu-tRNA(Gln) amidotransferase subunit GatC [Flavobacteriales bacterium]HJN63836.1 Asp-tRNA(Asn)/Glu-tRNA(Gln) amidotransferase subunit GatC [Flavobacteriales bacterium]|tara:strand:+ start:15599 stop:15895 length:297 start_codon:yes stop_codon:yes gene_type:complete